MQALTYPECRTAALHLPAHPSPFPAIGKGGGGKGQIRPWLPWERFCAQYGLIFDCRQKSIRIQHSQRQGSWGSAPSVIWYRAPGGTRGPLGKGGAAERWRVAYPIGIATRHGAKPATTHTSKRNASAASGDHHAFAKDSATPTGDYQLGQNSFAAFFGEKQSPPGPG